MSYQFDLTRNATLNFVKELDNKTADYKAPYFSNTIRWHVGHVLVTAESLLFGFPDHSDTLPKNYNDLFATGTKPEDWSDEPPSLSELTKQLEEQKTRMDELTDNFFQKNLDYTLPFGDFKTYGDVFEMILQHENEHLGKMKAMKQVADKSE